MKNKLFKTGLMLMSSITLGTTLLPVTTVFADSESDNVEQVRSVQEFNFNPNLNEIQKIDGIDDNGQEFSVIAEPVNNGMNRAATQSWKVWYTGGLINAYFYMNVSNNKVTSAYNKKINTLGGTYSGDKLSKTNTYARLSFNVKSVTGWSSATCWLQGKVTGKGNNIKVTWSM